MTWPDKKAVLSRGSRTMPLSIFIDTEGAGSKRRWKPPF